MRRILSSIFAVTIAALVLCAIGCDDRSKMGGEDEPPTDCVALGTCSEDDPPPPAAVDTDGDGITDDLDLCASTPIGEGVNDTGCACSQIVGEDGTLTAKVDDPAIYVQEEVVSCADKCEGTSWLDYADGSRVPVCENGEITNYLCPEPTITENDPRCVATTEPPEVESKLKCYDLTAINAKLEALEAGEKIIGVDTSRFVFSVEPKCTLTSDELAEQIEAILQSDDYKRRPFFTKELSLLFIMIKASRIFP